MEVEPEERCEESGVGSDGGEAAAGGDHLGEGGEVEGCGGIGPVEVLGGVSKRIYTYVHFPEKW